MKHTLALFGLLASMAVACGGPAAESSAMPDDLEGKKRLLAQKRAQLERLQTEIAQLERAIAEMDPAQAAVQPVTVVPVARTDFQHFVEVQGTVVSDQVVKVSPEVGGRILQLFVEEGEWVDRGQLLARIDVAQLRKQLAELETALQLATEVYDRQKRLWDQQIGSEIQFLQAKNDKERLEKRIETLKHQLGKSEVHAPIAGEVDVVFAKAGELVSPGMPLLQILDTRHVKVRADVPENYLKAVRRGLRVQVKIPALGQTRTAPIRRVGNVIDPANRTFPIDIPLRNADGLLKPNLLAIVYLNDFTEKDVVVLPLEALQQELGGAWYVFVVEEGPQGPVARKKYVETGPSYDGRIVVTQGLMGNEKLIVEGARTLADNQPIQVVTAQTPGSNG